MRGRRVRWENVGKLAAGLVAVIVAIVSLPSLLGGSEPPPPPPDVGLAPAEPSADDPPRGGNEGGPRAEACRQGWGWTGIDQRGAAECGRPPRGKDRQRGERGSEGATERVRRDRRHREREPKKAAEPSPPASSAPTAAPPSPPTPPPAPPPSPAPQPPPPAPPPAPQPTPVQQEFGL